MLRLLPPPCWIQSMLLAHGFTMAQPSTLVAIWEVNKADLSLPFSFIPLCNCAFQMDKIHFKKEQLLLKYFFLYIACLPKYKIIALSYKSNIRIFLSTYSYSWGMNTILENLVQNGNFIYHVWLPPLCSRISLWLRFKFTM